VERIWFLPTTTKWEIKRKRKIQDNFANPFVYYTTGVWNGAEDCGNWAFSLLRLYQRKLNYIRYNTHKFQSPREMKVKVGMDSNSTSPLTLVILLSGIFFSCFLFSFFFRWLMRRHHSWPGAAIIFFIFFFF
jgi:hypothetical protein